VEVWSVDCVEGEVDLLENDDRRAVLSPHSRIKNEGSLTIFVLLTSRYIVLHLD